MLADELHLTQLEHSIYRNNKRLPLLQNVVESIFCSLTRREMYVTARGRDLLRRTLGPLLIQNYQPGGTVHEGSRTQNELVRVLNLGRRLLIQVLLLGWQT